MAIFFHEVMMEDFGKYFILSALEIFIAESADAIVCIRVPSELIGCAHTSRSR